MSGERVGFVGLGAMGWPMAARLVGAGYEVGGVACVSAAQAARGAAFLVTMLPTSRQVEAVLAEARPSLARGALVIETTSGQPAATRRLAETLAGDAIELVDAPVSGGVKRAQDGKLAIMAGGEAEALDRAEPLLRAMGTTIHRVGGVGAGQAMKALNNLVSAGGFLIAVEALLIGQRFGLDPALMVDVLNASTGVNNSTQNKLRQQVLSRAFDAGFGLDLMVKDLSTALEVGRDTATPTPFAALCREMWSSAAGLLGPGQDHTAAARLSERLAGDELGRDRRH